MSAEGNAGTGNDELKAKMREALEKKKSSDRGVEHKGRERGEAQAHGPAAVKREHRRKTG